MEDMEIVTVGTPTANCYLVKGDAPYLVDTNTPRAGKRLMEAISRSRMRPEELRYILVTHYHYDHTGNLAELKRLSGARVAAGERDAEVIAGRRPPAGPGNISPAGRLLRRLPASLLEKYQHFESCEVDLPLHEGMVLDELGLEILELPGHTEGGVAYFHREKRLAFIGDMVSNILNRPGPPFLSFSYDRRAIVESMRRLAQLDLEYAYPGHGKVIGPGASEKIGHLAERLSYRWKL
ncbi:MBL fold metallo-hydrolase [Candidatus Solincola tengchongensis]|uniref:MBL fold metallo-hydrolase n=1 Tax=Candidatus Solincola tengchongensis TaxID=2900693 RepID=UPI00257E0980|nr:MBL fold metallo-hydrolase [Candidatus Solincola tengchongensis]